MEALFLKMVNLSLTAGWLVLAVLIFRGLLRKAPRWIFCALWGLVALRLICPFSVESTWSLIPSAEPLPQNIIYTAAPQIHSGVTMIDQVVNPVLSSSLTPADHLTSANPTQIWSFILSWIWVAGIAAMLIYAGTSYLLLKRKVSTATLLQKNIKQSEQVDSPFVLGFFKAVIYLPYKIPENDLEYVIAHEQAHIQRKDHWWKLIGFVILSVYWFNPLLWIAYILLCRDIEAACDEKVIKKMEKDGRRAYSTALLNCSVHRSSISACPLAFGEVGVKERVKAVMNYKKPAFWSVTAAVLVCAVVAVCFLTNPKQNSFSVRITVPAGSQEEFVYSDEEISPTRNQIIVSSGDNLGDTEVILKPIEVKQENAYDEATYLTPGMAVRLQAEKGGWFKIGVNMQNDTDEDIVVYVDVKNVEIRIAGEESGQWDLIPMVMVNGILYLDTGYASPVGTHSGTMEGEITSMVDGSKEPSVNDQSNFGTGYGYQYGETEGTVELYMNGEWRIFATEEVRQEIQFPTGSQANDSNEIITYNGKKYKKSELCDQTLEWLELTEEEKIASSYLPPEFLVFEETWGITLTAENITQTGLTLVCNQAGGEPTGKLQTGSWYILENWTKENGWKEIEWQPQQYEVAWTQEAWIIPMDSAVEWEVDWEWLYGKLPTGKYRIGKEITDFRNTGDYDKKIYFAEFEIK